MNILFITYQGGIAGSTFSVAYLARGMAERGHNVWLASRKNTLYPDLLKDSKVIFTEIPLKGKTHRESVKQITDLVKREGIQIVNSQASRDRYLTIWARKLAGMKAALIHTRRQSPRPSAAKLQGAFYTWGTDSIIAVSSGLKRELTDVMGIPPEHIHVIRNGTPESKYETVEKSDTEQLRKKLGIGREDFVIGCISRHKMQEQLIQAVKLIEEFSITLVLAGIREDEIELSEEEWPSHHRVICTGRLEPEEALNYHRLLRAHILPSVTEGLSQSLLESMFLGIPVAATDAAGNRDLIENGRTGYLFPPHRREPLAEMIRNLHDHPEKGRAMAEEARRTVKKNYSMERVLNEYEEYFSSFL